MTSLVCLMIAIACGVLINYQVSFQASYPASFQASYPAQVSLYAYLPNLMAFGIAVPLLLRSRWVASFARRHHFILAIAALLAIGATLLFPGIDSVQRWLRIGPFALNAAMAFIPVVLLGIVFAESYRVLFLVGLPAFILVLQPDAGQATAFASAATVILISESRLSNRLRWFSLLFVLISWAMSWSRPDPLAPVAHVEGILQLAWAQGIFSKTLVVLAIGAVFYPFLRKLIDTREPRRLVLVKCYLTYLIVTFAVTGIGNFPVPLIGAGAAPVIGWCLALAFCD